MAINTNTPVSKTERRVYKRFKNLSVNEEPLPQGDGTIRISPFDDYYIFTFYNEVDNENTPIDLSNVGTIYISFIGENDEIRIPYYTNVQEVDLSQGQVLFRISKDNSKKILKLDNDNFYVSTQMKAEDGAESDESVIYTGKFLSLTDEARQSLTSQIEDLTLQYTKEVAELTDTNTSLRKEIEVLKAKLAQSQLISDNLRSANEKLTNELAKLVAKIPSADAIKVLNEAADAQAQSQKERAERQQQEVLAKNNSSRSRTRRAVTEQDASRLKKYYL